MTSRGLRGDWSPDRSIGERVSVTGRIWQRRPGVPVPRDYSQTGRVGHLFVSIKNGELRLLASDHHANTNLAEIFVNAEELESAIKKVKTNPTIAEYHRGSE